ncbi:MAG: AraC family transcriptional regulator [candidate division Zixibacteria bacterium]|nr:AraC family transcriptional regulator [candidate division Zixibacteria bacterium]
MSETPHYVNLNGKEHLLEDVFFAGLHDQFRNTYMKLSGKVHMLGVCFYPEGFYPFFKIPVSEFKNQLLGAIEVGFNLTNTINEQLKAAPDIATRLSILENKLLSLLNDSNYMFENFRQIFNVLKQNDFSIQISEFCQQNDINIRKLERMFNKYVGVSAKTYGTINRFQNSLNQILYSDYAKFTDIAYDNSYFDQTHFTKEFKRFAGNTPKNFVHQKNSILQIGKLT